MIPTIKSEFRKLFTVRSTYIILAIIFAFTALMSFYFDGYKGNIGTPASDLRPDAIQYLITSTASSGAFLISIIAVLFMAHEFRYNTITYTLTANTRRTTVFLVKMLVVAVFAVLFTLVISLFSVGVYHLGLMLRDASLPAQEIALLPTLGKVLFYNIAYALIGVLLAVFIRAIVGAIAILLLFPIMIEPLAGVLLKDKAMYLPFSALEAVLGSGGAGIVQSSLTTASAIGISLAYVGVLAVVSWALFMKRDAV